MQSGISLVERDFFKNPFSEKEINELLEVASVTDIFSWRSPAVKKLGNSLEGIHDDGLIALMLKEPRLIKRPLIRVGAKLIIGANLKELANL